MASDLQGIVGQPLVIAQTVAADPPAFTITSATITIYGEDGTAVVTAATLTATPAFGNAAPSHQLYYRWTSPATAGDFRYVIVVSDGFTPPINGLATVWPAVSKYDRYVQRVQSWLQESDFGEQSQTLSRTDYRNGLNSTVERYSFGVLDERGSLRSANPQRLAVTVDLDAGVWEYELDDTLEDYEPRFSRFLRVEYPVDATAQTKYLLSSSDWAELPDEGLWRLTNAVPIAGEQAIITHTARQVLSHTVDTIPAYAFESVCQYAAGLLLAGPQAFHYLRTAAPEIAAGLISYEPRSRSANAYGIELMNRAVLAWEAANATVAPKRSGAWTLNTSGCR